MKLCAHSAWRWRPAFAFRGPACVGAIAFLVDSATKDALVFDKTVGVLTGWVIPQ